MATPSHPLAAQLTAHLTSKSLPPKATWLTQFLSTQRSTIPLPALKQTAIFRLLASDLSACIRFTSSSTFPSDILDASIASRRLSGHIPVQVVDIEDVGRSRWSQLEALEEAERGETTKAREVIRVVAGEDALSGPEVGVEKVGGPHKLLLQDARGCRVFAFELSPVDGLGLGMCIGSKMILTNVVVARGVLLLESKSATVLGGKIEALYRVWKVGRKHSLQEAVTIQNQQ